MAGTNTSPLLVLCQFTDRTNGLKANVTKIKRQINAKHTCRILYCQVNSLQ